jgi:GNAT superfamily N-acetyltransferase
MPKKKKMFIIREIRASDYEQWKPLWDGYNEFYGRSGATALDPDITQMTWSRFFDIEEPVYAVAAESNGTIVGIVHYIFHRSTTAIGLNCYMQDLFTSPAARGQGVGAALITAVYKKAKDEGAARLYWQTHETNLLARHLYDKVAENSGFMVYRKFIV